MIFHPHFCYVCMRDYIAKDRIEPCPYCDGMNIINWAGETYKRINCLNTTNPGKPIYKRCYEL